MTIYLDEVPGARERPGGCPIRVTRDGEVLTLTIPPRGVSPIILFFSLVLLGNLLVTLYTGVILLVLHKSVLFMAQVSPGGLPVSLRGFTGVLLAGLLGAEGLGFWTLAAILRPIFTREVLELDHDWLRVRHWEWGRMREHQMARSGLRGFVLRRVPPGLDSGILTVQGRGEEVEVGEFLREADREWLVSVGNALLR